jgi:hypothetical protein
MKLSQLLQGKRQDILAIAVQDNVPLVEVEVLSS